MRGVPMTTRELLGLVAVAVTFAHFCLPIAAQEGAQIKPPQPFTSGEALAAYNRANDLVRKGDYVAARRQFEGAIEIEPGNASAFMGRCIAYRRLRDHDHAMRDCNAAI